MVVQEKSHYAEDGDSKLFRGVGTLSQSAQSCPRIRRFWLGFVIVAAAADDDDDDDDDADDEDKFHFFFKTHQHISSRLLSEMFCCITSRSQCPDKQT